MTLLRFVLTNLAIISLLTSSVVMFSTASHGINWRGWLGLCSTKPAERGWHPKVERDDLGKLRATVTRTTNYTGESNVLYVSVREAGLTTFASPITLSFGAHSSQARALFETVAKEVRSDQELRTYAEQKMGRSVETAWQRDFEFERLPADGLSEFRFRPTPLGLRALEYVSKRLELELPAEARALVPEVLEHGSSAFNQIERNQIVSFQMQKGSGRDWWKQATELNGELGGRVKQVTETHIEVVDSTGHRMTIPKSEIIAESFVRLSKNESDVNLSERSVATVEPVPGGKINFDDVLLGEWLIVEYKNGRRTSGRVKRKTEQGFEFLNRTFAERPGQEIDLSGVASLISPARDFQSLIGQKMELKRNDGYRTDNNVEIMGVSRGSSVVYRRWDGLIQTMPFEKMTKRYQ